MRRPTFGVGEATAMIFAMMIRRNPNLKLTELMVEINAELAMRRLIDPNEPRTLEHLAWFLTHHPDGKQIIDEGII